MLSPTVVPELAFKSMPRRSTCSYLRAIRRRFHRRCQRIQPQCLLPSHPRSPLTSRLQDPPLTRRNDLLQSLPPTPRSAPRHIRPARQSRPPTLRPTRCPLSLLALPLTLRPTSRREPRNRHHSRMLASTLVSSAVTLFKHRKITMRRITRRL